MHRNVYDSIKLNSNEQVIVNVIQKDVDDVIKGISSPNSIKQKIINNLNRLIDGKEFDVIIIDTNRPFIMACYPDIEELWDSADKLADSLKELEKSNSHTFTKRYYEIKKWTIEIDSKILDKRSKYCVASGEEFIALLFHELGHVMNETPARIKYTYMQRSAKFNAIEKMILSDSKIVKYILLPMYLNFNNFMVITNALIVGNIEEMKADLRIPTDYRSAFISYLDRCILKDPVAFNSTIVNEKDAQAEMDKCVEFTRTTLHSLKARRTVMYNAIKYQNKENNSPSITKFLSMFNQLLFKANIDEDSVDPINESICAKQYAAIYDKAVIEAEALLEQSRVTDRDLMVLQVELDSIETQEDKLYVLHTVFDYIEIVSREISKKMKNIKDPSKVPPELLEDKRLKMLEDMKKAVVAKQILKEKQYGLYIQYPQGYEG